MNIKTKACREVFQYNSEGPSVKLNLKSFCWENGSVSIETNILNLISNESECINIIFVISCDQFK